MSEYINDIDDENLVCACQAKPEPSLQHDNAWDHDPAQDDHLDSWSTRAFDPKMKRYIRRLEELAEREWLTESNERD
jgi:hypothetical protein